jgi:hypothetical protein
MLLEGVPRGAVRVVRSAGCWVGSVVGGGGGRFVGTWAITRRFLAFFFWRLEFSSVGRFFCHLLYILSKFYHVGRGGCCAVVLGGWLLPAVAGVHKSTTVHLISANAFRYFDCQSSLGTTKTARWIPTIITATAFGLAIDSCDQDVGV